MTTASPTARSMAEALNRSARRILRSEKQADWNLAVLDAASGFCSTAALLTVQGAQLRLEDSTVPAHPFSIAAADAQAIQDALTDKEPVAAAISPRELSAPLAELLAKDSRGGRAVHLFPILSAGRPVALLAAVGYRDTLDPNGLELAATIAGAAWQLRSGGGKAGRASNAGASSASIGIVTLGGGGVPRGEASTPESHFRARRYASVKVAEWRLYESAKVTRGREEKNLYGLFREEIDRERARFRTVFLEKEPEMVDYLHEEIVRTLAQGQAEQMGEQYPGAMQLT